MGSTFGINFAAVAAAEIGHNDTHFRYWNFEYVGELGSYDERILRRRPDGNPAPGSTDAMQA